MYISTWSAEKHEVQESNQLWFIDLWLPGFIFYKSRHSKYSKFEQSFAHNQRELLEVHAEWINGLQGYSCFKTKNHISAINGVR